MDGCSCKKQTVMMPALFTCNILFYLWALLSLLISIPQLHLMLLLGCLQRHLSVLPLHA